MTRKRNASRNGFIFVFAIITLLVLLIFGAITLRMANAGYRLASSRTDWTHAQAAAEAAAEMAEANLRSLGYYPGGNTVIQFPATAECDMGEAVGYARVSVDPTIDPTDPTRHRYIVKAVGESKKRGARRVVTVRLQEQSFALYAYFSDLETMDSGQKIWFFPGDVIHGPVHSNDQFHLAWDTSDPDAPCIFADTLSSHADSIDWYERAPENDDEWERVLQGGRNALTLGADYIALPAVSDSQRIAAWGTDTFPTDAGVYIPNDGASVTAGIYINEPDCSIAFSVDDITRNQLVTVTNGDGDATVIDIDLDGGVTTVTTPDGTATTYAGTPNGALYSTGGISSLQGTLADNHVVGNQVETRNAWTVATDLSRDISITGDLKYATMPDPDQPLDAEVNLRAATLGLVSRNIKLPTDYSPTNCVINGSILATGSFGYDGYNQTLKGELRIHGGVIQRRRGPVGLFGSGGVQVRGFRKNYTYDNRLPYAPPPFFPTTGQYDIASWQARNGTTED